ncbi:proteobacterial dedicated sortase system response regulator [Thaumasiovibrio subtropicus]|uniref:proteobacterial dedicated sortase system response regulator n=1 Tax=Thaumasiovibrio subtropicus TaxID=1891207 RepID=UPI000B35D41E|nr:proteobacterial dedicated sortase system response regulator [Thaumasiovibrio subtropicus]
MKSIVIVEDETAIRENYIDVLTRQGYQVKGYANRTEAMAGFEQSLPDLALIDIGLEDEIDGGFQLCQTLRAKSPTLPIVFLTARDSDFDTVCGLRMGADDYLTKDISLPHLMARIAALFRRSEAQGQQTDDSDVIDRGLLSVDKGKMHVHWDSHAIDLTVTEFWMLHALVRRPGVVKSRQALMEEAHVVVDDNTITSHIKRIRKKFIAVDSNFDHISTVYGMGYRWQEPK